MLEVSEGEGARRAFRHRSEVAAGHAEMYYQVGQAVGHMQRLLQDPQWSAGEKEASVEAHCHAED